MERDLATIQLEGPNGDRLKYDILQLFPFTSESKRMGIILRVSCTHSSYTIDNHDSGYLGMAVQLYV